MHLFNWHVPGTRDEHGLTPQDHIEHFQKQLWKAEQYLERKDRCIDELRQKLSEREQELERVASLKDILKARVSEHIKQGRADYAMQELAPYQLRAADDGRVVYRGLTINEANEQSYRLYDGEQSVSTEIWERQPNGDYRQLSGEEIGMKLEDVSLYDQIKEMEVESERQESLIDSLRQELTQEQMDCHEFAEKLGELEQKHPSLSSNGDSQESQKNTQQRQRGGHGLSIGM